MRLNEFTHLFKKELDRYFDELENIPETLLDAMRYSVLNGGKRLRPYMVYIGTQYGKIDYNDMMQLAIAIELIHCYSLVHDDLPCMDNDTLRRGVPTTHIKYNDAIATLTGDAMLNQAFEIISNLACMNMAYAKAMHYIAIKVGSKGMIAGQILDINEGDTGQNEIIRIYSLKTSALFSAGLVGGAIASQADSRIIDLLEEFSYNLGIAFQIADDLLDISSTTNILGKDISSDTNKDKNTIVKAVGYDNALNLKEIYENSARVIAQDIDNNDLLIDLMELLVNRIK